jgi:hypothetical protein
MKAFGVSPAQRRNKMVQFVRRHARRIRHRFDGRLRAPVLEMKAIARRTES